MEKSLQTAEEFLMEIGTVTEWAEKMGYDNPKKFSIHFREYFGQRPLKVLNTLRLIKAIELLASTDQTVFEIGHYELNIGDEKRLYQFVKYHICYSPREIRDMNKREVSNLIEILGSKIRE